MFTMYIHEVCRSTWHDGGSSDSLFCWNMLWMLKLASGLLFIIFNTLEFLWFQKRQKTPIPNARWFAKKSLIYY